ncbi:MAG: hypothetical protein ABSG56_29565 [Bryobacteraceae bacterium]|jgi:hypothetical protein
MSSNRPTKRGKPFELGNHSGKGRPPGSGNKSNLALEEMFDGKREILTRKMFELAQEGRPWALKFCMERIFARLPEKPMNLQLPKIHTREDLVQAYQEVVQAAAEGRMTSEQAERMTTVLVSGQKFIENDELSLEVQALKKEVQELKEEIHARPVT